MLLKQTFFITLTTLAFVLKMEQTEGKPKLADNVSADNDVLSKLGSIFKVGPGMMVFNTRPSGIYPNAAIGDDDDIYKADNIMCAERIAGKSYCTEVPNYLETTQLDKIAPQQFEQFSSHFKDDFLPSVNVTNRMGEDGDESEENFCNNRPRIIYPKSVETKESKWVLVVQHEQYRQGVLVEQCENEGSSCKYENLLPNGITSKCKQHYMFRSLVVLVNGVLKEQMVKLPNYCECVLRFDSNKRFW